MEDHQVFSERQCQELDKPLDPRLVSQRKGGGNITLKYVEGHDCIDSANRIFGYGCWSYRPLSCEQKVLIDPITGEAVGVAYKAQVELIVRGCIAPIVEVGSQPVASWNVNEVVMGRRKKEDKKRPVEDWEKTNAMRTIVEAHEMAEKGAVTDALKRALRTFGEQFGNGLYGDGRVMFEDEYVIDEGALVQVKDVHPGNHNAQTKRIVEAQGQTAYNRQQIASPQETSKSVTPSQKPHRIEAGKESATSGGQLNGKNGQAPQSPLNTIYLKSRDARLFTTSRGNEQADFLAWVGRLFPDRTVASSQDISQEMIEYLEVHVSQEEAHA